MVLSCQSFVKKIIYMVLSTAVFQQFLSILMLDTHIFGGETPTQDWCWQPVSFAIKVDV